MIAPPGASDFLVLSQAHLTTYATLASCCGMHNFGQGKGRHVHRPDYRALKSHLRSVLLSISKYEFVHLMGRRSDSKLFFYVDGEPSGSKDEPSPGQVYEGDHCSQIVLLWEDCSGRPPCIRGGLTLMCRTVALMLSRVCRV